MLKRKTWLEKRNLKIQKRNRKRKRKKKYNRVVGCELKNAKGEIGAKVNEELKEVSLQVPKNFSLENNPEETIEFFSKLRSYEKTGKSKIKFFIDSSEIVTLTVDALMYLIAVIVDLTNNPQNRYKFLGNFPKSEKIKKLYINSGFMSYVKSKENYSKESNCDKIQIKTGAENEPDIAKYACEYTQEKCKLGMIETRPLYNILIEMMGNTKQHAYEEKMTDRAKYWYLFAEEADKYVKFVFLDTGLGIPATVKKKLIKEKILGFVIEDSQYIKSALNGENRTQTNKPNRGKGLPQISECFKQGLLSDVYIASGKGSCLLSETEKTFKTKEYSGEMLGTLFSWKIKKGQRINDKD